MSTIFGIIDKAGRGFDSGWLEIQKMSLMHGAYDRTGLWNNKKVGLGNLQVFNTPESLSEILPLENISSGVTICSDSRIDNREDLAGHLSIKKSELYQINYSELILKAYLKWGVNVCNFLRGDYSFGIYDKTKELFFLTRDHFGIRPIFYFDHPHYFIFSSEIRGILSLPFFEKKLNNNWLFDYLLNSEREQYDSFYQGIYSLLPGHYLTIKSGNVSFSKYWELTIPNKVILKSDTEYIEAYKELFTNAVKRRVRSAFPIGAELSGGLDSSSVCSFAQKILSNTNSSLHVFARVLPDKIIPELDDNGQDESSEIFKVCQFCGIHNIHKVTMENQGIIDNIRKNIEIIQSPYFSNYAVYNLNTHKFAKAEGIRTILSGHGGDQMLSNPAHFVYLNYKRKLMYLKLFCDIMAKNTIHELGFVKSLSFLYNIRNNKSDSLNTRKEIRKLFKFGINPDFILKHKLEERYLNHRQKALLFPDNLQDLIRKITHPHLNNRIEITGILAGHDQIEFRYPMFDVDLIHFYLSVPDNIKRKYRFGRYIHRMAMTNELPLSIQWRTDKYGTINPGLARIFSNQAAKVKTEMENIRTFNNGKFIQLFDNVIIEKLINSDNYNLFNYKSLINKFFQLECFQEIIENNLEV